MTDKKKAGWRPGSGKKYDPNDPHLNPLHPPEGYPEDLQWKEWFGADWEKEKAEWEKEKKELEEQRAIRLGWRKEPPASE